MEKTIRAVYENGVLRPLEPLSLAERQQVTVTISDAKHEFLVPSEEWSGAAQDDISLEEVRRVLATIQGSLSEAVIEERRERCDVVSTEAPRGKIRDHIPPPLEMSWPERQHHAIFARRFAKSGAGPRPATWLFITKK